MKPITNDQVSSEFHEVKGTLEETTGTIVGKVPRVEKIPGIFTTRAVVVMVVFLATVIVASVNLAGASPGKVKFSSTAVEHVENRIKELRTAIKITEAQELLWNNLTIIMRKNASEMDALTKEKAATPKAMNAVEDLKFHLVITQAQAAQMEEFIPPFEALYISLSDAQKMSADSMFQKGRHPRHKRK